MSHRPPQNGRGAPDRHSMYRDTRIPAGQYDPQVSRLVVNITTALAATMKPSLKVASAEWFPLYLTVTTGVMDLRIIPYHTDQYDLSFGASPRPETFWFPPGAWEFEVRAAGGLDLVATLLALVDRGPMHVMEGSRDMLPGEEAQLEEQTPIRHPLRPEKHPRGYRG